MSPNHKHGGLFANRLRFQKDGKILDDLRVSIRTHDLLGVPVQPDVVAQAVGLDHHQDPAAVRAYVVALAKREGVQVSAESGQV